MNAIRNMIMSASVIIMSLFFAGISLANQLAGYSTVNLKNTEGIFPKMESNGGTGIAFVNTENEAASVVLSAYNDYGNMVATETVRVGAHAKVVKVPERIFSKDISSATHIYYTSDREIVGFQVNNSSDGAMLDALPALSGSSVKLFFPRTISKNKWEAEVGLINASKNRNLVGTITAYDFNGIPLLQTIPITLLPYGRYEFNVGNTFLIPANVSYIVFNPISGTAAGYVKFFVNGIYRAAIPALPNHTATELNVSHIASNQTWWTELSLINTNTTSKDIEVDFDNGTSKTFTINAGQQRIFTVKELFGDQAQSGIHSAVIRNASGVVGIELFGNTTQLSGIKLEATDSSVLYYPHIASTNGWNTGVVAYNPGISTCDLTITPYSATGQMLQTLNSQIAAHGKFVGVVSKLGFPPQAAWFKIDSSTPITGFELFGYNAQPNQENITGTWVGTWTSTEPGYTGSITANITQNGNQISGTMDVTNTDCGNVHGVPFTGTVSGNEVTFNASYNCDGATARLEFTHGLISGNVIRGTYHEYVNNSPYDTGTFILQKQ